MVTKHEGKIPYGGSVIQFFRLRDIAASKMEEKKWELAYLLRTQNYRSVVEPCMPAKFNCFSAE
jgi:hypothetical protein